MSQKSILVSEDGKNTAELTIENDGSFIVKISGICYYINLTPI